MKPQLSILSLLLLAGTLSSCDAFRVLAGRPTSKEIEAKKICIEQREAEHRARLDSLARLQTYLRDTQEDFDLTDLGFTPKIGTRQLSESSQKELCYRYYVIIGTFRGLENAISIAGRAESNGYPVTYIRYANGLTAVGICPSNSLRAVCDNLNEALKESFCPSDAWILDNVDFNR